MSETAAIRGAVSNTGPIISAFQSERVDVLRQLYDVIFIPDTELAEFEKHGAEGEIRELIDDGFVIVHRLSDTEKQTAREMAEAIASSSLSKDKEAAHHYPEAEAMVLMSRLEADAQEILLDELAARSIAQEHGIAVIGFAGVLIRASRQDLLSAEAVRDALMTCQQQGTHYSDQFIGEIYRR
ncbi:MAG: hypothetical protein HY260_02275, partial [Chloroflexi bacterium]|nr:hypothetical protein [Chloroflexota bacterium]